MSNEKKRNFQKWDSEGKKRKKKHKTERDKKGIPKWPNI